MNYQQLFLPCLYLWRVICRLACSRMEALPLLQQASYTHSQMCVCLICDPSHGALLFGSFAPSAGLWITTRRRMKIAAAIKFSSHYCLCAIIHHVHTELLLLLMLPWCCAGVTLSVLKGVWQVSPTALYWLHVKPKSRHLLLSPLLFASYLTHFFLVFCWLSLSWFLTAGLVYLRQFDICECLLWAYVCICFRFPISVFYEHRSYRWSSVPSSASSGWSCWKSYSLLLLVLIFLPFAFLLLFGSPSAPFPLLK